MFSFSKLFLVFLPSMAWALCPWKTRFIFSILVPGDQVATQYFFYFIYWSDSINNRVVILCQDIY